MNKDHNARLQTIHAASRYAGKGRTELEVIKSVLVKNRITAVDVTPVSVSFISWKMDDAAFSGIIRGFLTWNSINCMPAIEYHLDASVFTGTDQYSLALKWYLSRWNEEQKGSKGCRTGFLYSPKNGQEIILRTSGRVSPAFPHRKVKHIFLRLHDIIPFLTVCSRVKSHIPHNSAVCETSVFFMDVRYTICFFVCHKCFSFQLSAGFP